jgi:hypothetical protein
MPLREAIEETTAFRPRRAAGQPEKFDRSIRIRIRPDPGRNAALLALAIPASISPFGEWCGEQPAESVCRSQNPDENNLKEKQP